MITATILPDGALRLTAGNEARSTLAQWRDAGRSYWQILAEALEPYWANGGFEHFDAGGANPFVGLTSAPCIAESIDCDDNGKCSIVGRLWYFPDYCIRDDLGELIAKGRVVYAFGFDASDDGEG